MLRILVICTGNTCRSPMAEALLNEKIRQQGLADRVQVFSAGLSPGGIFPASQGAQLVLKKRGLDLSVHRSRQVTPECVQAADFVMTMTEAHKKVLLGLAPQSADKVFTLAEYAGETDDVRDPFGYGLDVYEACADYIGRLVDKAWLKIVHIAGKNGLV